MALPGVSEFSEHTGVKVILDHRELPEFDSLLEGLGAAVRRKQLEVGDFLCSDRLVIERKTREDFENSIIDGRLFRQLGNLLHNFGRPVVVVEGEDDFGRISREALMGAYASVISDYGVPLFFTKDAKETAELVFFFAKHEQLSKRQPLRVFAKRKALTPSQSQRAVVEMLPMIGPKLAKAILLHFGSIEQLIKASEKELEQVPGLGKKRANVIRSLILYKYNDEEDEL